MSWLKHHLPHMGIGLAILGGLVVVGVLIARSGGLASVPVVGSLATGAGPSPVDAAGSEGSSSTPSGTLPATGGGIVSPFWQAPLSSMAQPGNTGQTPSWPLMQGGGNRVNPLAPGTGTPNSTPIILPGGD